MASDPRKQINIGSSQIFVDIDVNGNVKAEYFDGPAESATNDSSGNQIDQTYVKKAGDAMTGTLVFPPDTTKDNQELIRWNANQNDQNSYGVNWGGINTYTSTDTNKKVLNISNYDGINFTTQRDQDFMLNGLPFGQVVLKTVYKTVLHTGWSKPSGQNYYTYIIDNIDGMTDQTNPIMGVHTAGIGGDKDRIEMLKESFSLIANAESGTNRITLYCFEDDAPNIDIPVAIKF